MVGILTNHFFLITITLALSVAYLFHFSLVQAYRNGGLSAKLIHRNSPLSPLYNPSETPSQQVTNALQRSINRVKLFRSTNLLLSSNDPESTVVSDKGEYLMKISIGTPPVEISGVADTASDLTWIQCMPCSSCYTQKAPLFDPKNSNTYKVVSCPSSQCQTVTGTSCSENICHYKRLYTDRSYSNGIVATETITLNSSSLGQTVSLPQIIIGCGNNNSGLFNENGSGMIGLGRGSMSLISQMDSAIDGKFSYCLVPAFSQLNSSSKMTFGKNAVVSGTKVVSTPLLSGDLKSFYFVKLEAMSVGRKRLQYNSTLIPIAPGRGNIIVDSGTTLTMLAEDFYNRLELTVSKAVRSKRVTHASRYLSLCYKTKSAVKAPIITAHFTGADVKLTASNTFIRVSMDIVCFAFRPITQGNAIFGNMAQTNFLIGFDLKKESLSFKPTVCTKN